MNGMTEEQVMTFAEVAEYYRINPRTLEKLIAEGLPCLALGPRVRRFRLSQVEEWLLSRNLSANELQSAS